MLEPFPASCLSHIQCDAPVYKRGLMETGYCDKTLTHVVVKMKLGKVKLNYCVCLCKLLNYMCF